MAFLSDVTLGSLHVYALACIFCICHSLLSILNMFALTLCGATDLYLYCKCHEYLFRYHLMQDLWGSLNSDCTECPFNGLRVHL